MPITAPASSRPKIDSSPANKATGSAASPISADTSVRELAVHRPPHDEDQATDEDHQADRHHDHRKHRLSDQTREEEALDHEAVDERGHERQRYRQRGWQAGTQRQRPYGESADQHQLAL